MPKRAKGLVAVGLGRLPPGRHGDGGGLYLLVRPDGGRFWLFRYTRNKRSREMGLGSFETVGLSAARERAREAADLLKAGLDPLDKRQADLAAEEAARAAAAAVAAETERTFRVVAEELIAAQSPAWTSEKTLASWRLTLDKHGYPALGDKPIAGIGRADVIGALKPIWTKQPATARKLQRRIAAVLDYAAANGWRAADNPAQGRVLRLTKALPAVNAKGRRQASLPWQRVPAFMGALEAMSGASPLALRFAALTALRSSEIRNARWDQMDLANGLWVVPGRQMKGGRAKELPPHRVPLSGAALRVLREAVALRTGSAPSEADLAAQAALLGDALVFPNSLGGALSDAALGAVIKRMNGEAKPATWRDADGRAATAHGLRRSFRSWVDDERPEDAAAAEKQLAHEEPNSVTAAYRGSDLLARRVALLAAWADVIAPEARPAGAVVTLREAVGA